MLRYVTFNLFVFSGFVKEQVRITFAASPGVIKVDGQRPLGNNKWSRFNQTFPIQENCDVSKIHGKFSNPILTITIPKLGITQVGPKEVAKPSQQAPPTPSKTPTAGPQEAAAEPKAQKSTPSARDEKKVMTIMGGKDEIPPKRIDEKRVEFTAEHVDRKDQSEAKGKPTEPKNAERVAETSLQKEREANERSKEAGDVPKILEKAKRKSKSSGSAVDREKRTEEDSIAANVMAAAKEGMRNLGKGVNDEEKQMLINMGAAVLVLLALGASASYSLWSSGKTMN
ncbi:unnamed protein product [Prunus armeniaca]|uniref:SHSP domain-containing protein n=1 Tax=Prunus armeniaca TaxID=36596 RepID=A0A6J5TZH3_PRUAR|nr:unnamed protein product [Prunus armeniaca]